jgi:hypothetical protein
MTTHRQALLKDRLTDLKDLIRDEHCQIGSEDLRKWVVLVLGEIDSWLSRGEGVMTCEAQITLSNMESKGPTRNDICNQFSCKV